MVGNRDGRDSLSPPSRRVVSLPFPSPGGVHQRISPLQGSGGFSFLPRALPEAVMRCPVGAPELPHFRNCFHAESARMPAGACGHSRF
jgi:hypothetical protein